MVYVPRGLVCRRNIERTAYDSLTLWYFASSRRSDPAGTAAFGRRFPPELQGLFRKVRGHAGGTKSLHLATTALVRAKPKASASIAESNATAPLYRGKIPQALCEEIKL